MMTLVKVGDVLAGKYHVDRILGIGGMGIVIAATHRELDQRVALKFMLPDALANEAATERFLREAKAAVKLRSEHICRVLDTGRLDSGGPYIVMEFLEGEDLAQVIKRRGRIPLGELVDLILQAIEGVAEAHANRIVHRDLKPGNLFVTTDNDGSPLVKVLDFGISKSALGGSATKTGDMMGSPAYMAPEQMMSSKDVDARADVWALGVILYQAATAALPFEADTLPALCMAVMGQTPRLPSDLRSELPASFATVVMRCLEKQPEARFADVATLAAALVPFGSPDAAATATRIGKVLRRAKATAPPPIEVAMAISTAARLAVTEGVAAPRGGISTLSASAAELAIPPRPRRTRALLAIAGAVVAAGVITFIIVRSGGACEPASAAPAVAPSALTVEPIAPAAVPEAKTMTPATAVTATVTPTVTPTVPVPVTPTAIVTPAKPSAKAATKVVAATKKSAAVTAGCPSGQTLVKGTCSKAAEPAIVPPVVKPEPVPDSSDDRWTHMQHDKGH